MSNTKSLKSAKPKLYIARTLCYIVLILLAAMSLFPFVILVINSTRTHGQVISSFSLIPGGQFVQNWKGLMLYKKSLDIFRGMWNSFYIAVLTSVLSVYFSAITAYAIHAYQFKFKNFMFRFILFVMMIPTQVSSFGFYRMMMKVKGIDHYWPLILPAIAAPATFFFIKQYMESSLTMDIIEAARIDGSNEIRTFNRIILPILKPALAVQLIFTFVTSWNNYFMPALIINSPEKRTLPILIYALRNADYLHANMAGVYLAITLAVLPVIIVFLALSKFIISGLTLGSVKG